MRGHPERSEGSHGWLQITQFTVGDLGFDCEVLRYAQDDILVERWALSVER
jgi:hypothetical protein